jgi:uncharacterized protein (TIGR03437 family)
MRISPRTTRLIVGVLALALALHTLTTTQRAQVSLTQRAGESTDQLRQRLAGRQRRLDKGNWTDSKREQEVRAWHAAVQERARLNAQSGQAVRNETSVVNTDSDDIDIMQGDSNLITQADPFDLLGRAVTFSQSGNGYNIQSAAGAFDTNLGTKVDLTQSPAVNPKVGVIPGVGSGDDAYLPEAIGFNFPFFGTSFSTVYISSNGFLSFRPAGIADADFDDQAASSGESLASFQTEIPRIAPYWHDLDASASNVAGGNGIFFRKDADRIVVTWNYIPDFPNDPTVDNGVNRFQATLFSDGRIVLAYDPQTIRLTSTALVGISPGLSAAPVQLVNLSNPAGGALSGPLAELFSTAVRVDVLGVTQSFYAAHPNRDVYDFVYIVTDFDFELGGSTFAFYQPVRNDISGLGQPTGDSDPTGSLGTRKMQGILNLSNIATSTFLTYPESPTVRFLGANHGLSVMGQEQGHRWLAYFRYPGNLNLLLGRDNAHWSFFLNIESTLSTAATPRSSLVEGSVWRDNGNGTFTTTNLIDGYSRLDQYAIGVRAAADVPDTFVITNPSNTNFAAASSPRPNVMVTGSRETVTIGQIIQRNGPRIPDPTVAPKRFRAAVVLLVREGFQPTAATLAKVKRYRLAWESYFAQSTDYLGRIDTALSDSNTSRVVAAASAASFQATFAPAEIGALFGEGFTNGESQQAPSQPLPDTLAGIQVLVDGTPAPLFYVSPGQINFQVPRTTASGTINPSVPSSTSLVEVLSGGALIRACAIQVAASVPAIFTNDQSGSGPAAAVDAFSFANAPFNALQANGQPNVIAVFGTGLGQDATDVDGSAGGVTASIDGAPAAVLYAGRAPGFTGLNQLNITLTAGISSGTHTLVVSRNGIASRPVTIAIR